MNEMNVETVDVRFELRELVEAPLLRSSGRRACASRYFRSNKTASGTSIVKGTTAGAEGDFGTALDVGGAVADARDCIANGRSAATELMASKSATVISCVWTFIAYLAAVSSKTTIWRANVCQFSRKLSRQREDVYGVAAAVRVRLGSQAQAGGSNRAAAAGDGNVLAAVD